MNDKIMEALENFKKAIDENKASRHLSITKLPVPDKYKTIAETRFNKIADKDAGYRTLFLSKIVRTTLYQTILGEESSTPSDILNQFVLPTLDKVIAAGVEVIGSLAPPGSIKMAITDLSQPYGVFFFVTVKDTDNLAQILAENGLSSLLEEGVEQTIKE
jgi:hypothetical protein